MLRRAQARRSIYATGASALLTANSQPLVPVFLHPTTRMAKKDQAADLLLRGLPPSQIAQQMHITPAVVMQYLCLKIGEGELRRSDIAFSLPHDARVAIEEIIEKADGPVTVGKIQRELRKRHVTANRVDVGIYLHYRRARVVLGDMYELVRNVEVRLHSFVKQAFIAEFTEENWWRSGVPDNIRAECAALLEKDPEPADEPYCYTHLINLREILDKRWPVLSKFMPKQLLNQKKELMERLLKLNRIRNSVMHPVRNSAITEEDFEFVRDLASDLSDLRVHDPSDVPQETITEAIEAAGSDTPPLAEPVATHTPASESGPAHELVTAITDAAPTDKPETEDAA